MGFSFVEASVLCVIIDSKILKLDEFKLKSSFGIVDLHQFAKLKLIVLWTKIIRSSDDALLNE